MQFVLPSRFDLFVREQLDSAAGAGLVPGLCKIIEDSARIFLPEEISLEVAEQCDFMKSFVSAATNREHGAWVRRPDAAEEVASWLLDACNEDDMVSEAGYSKIGDPFLDKISHISLSNAPFAFCRIEQNSKELVVFLLRIGNPVRLLAVVSKELVCRGKYQLPLHGQLLVSAFDGDAIIVCEFESPH